MDKDPPLGHLRTPSDSPWSDRQHAKIDDGDPRDPFDRDRDRILHSESFRRLQHKAQVFIVTESDLFRTRITHSLEVAQIARSLAKRMGLSESLVEAICLGHDAGHTPFGHIGEDTLNDLLSDVGGWNSNTHSLYVLDELESQYPDHMGLDLTFATREGIARHKTRFDVPQEFGDYASPSLEAQIANVADPLAYATHDIHDALQYRLLSEWQLAELDLDVWAHSWRITEGEFNVAHPEGRWPGVDTERLKVRRVHRHMIDYLVRDVWETSLANADGIVTLDEARQTHEPLISFSDDAREQVDKLLDFMLKEVYKSPLVARQNEKARIILASLFGRLRENQLLLPRHVQERIAQGGDLDREVAYFLASLTDRSAIDLYKELHEPDDRAMGHHVL